MQKMRRRWLLQAGAVGGVGIAAAACARAKPQAAARPANTSPKRGGVLIHAGGLAGDLDTVDGSIDPHTATAPGGKSYRLVYQGLLGYDIGTYAVQSDWPRNGSSPRRLIRLHASAQRQMAEQAAGERPCPQRGGYRLQPATSADS